MWRVARRHKYANYELRVVGWRVAKAGAIFSRCGVIHSLIFEFKINVYLWDTFCKCLIEHP